MSKPIELTGKKFGRLTPLSIAGKSKRGCNLWECMCDCGNMTTLSASEIHKGITLSCGCLRNEMTSKRFSTHRLCKSEEYKSWRSMKGRCLDPNSNRYSKYGGAGIKINERWLGKSGFGNFLADMGPKPGPEYSIDRYPDNNGDYGPVNCRWATIDQQTRNRSSNVWIEYQGERMILTDWVRKLGLNIGTVRSRIQRGLTFEEAIKPARPRPNVTHGTSA